MSNDKPRLGQGNIPIMLNGVEQELKPSLYAVQTLSRKYMGLQAVLERVARLDFETCCDVIEVGLGRRISNPREKQELAEAIFEAGLTDDTGGLAAACARYVATLMRGGKPLSSEEIREMSEGVAEGIEPGNGTSSSSN